MTTITAGLIQMGLKIQSQEALEKIRDVMLDAHEPMVEQAAKLGVQVLCMQELFNMPYFPPSRDIRWYAAAESVPDGPTVSRVSRWASQYGMVIAAPVYELEAPGVYYNTTAVIDTDGQYLGKYRKNHIPDIVDWPEKFFFKPGNLGFPVFKTAVCILGAYICYDRHFPEGFRAMGLSGADLVMVPTATGSHSRHIWELEIQAAAVANGFFVGAVNRVGEEAPWCIARFFGNSFFTNPRGEILAQGGDGDELIVATIDLAVAKEVRQYWQFYRDRRPDAYHMLSDARIM